MSTVNLSIDEVRDIAIRALKNNGCDDRNAAAIAETMTVAERDLCHSHGLFRLPGYLASLKSGKINGKANPTVTQLAPAVVHVHGDNGVASLPIEVGRQPLIDATRTNGIAALAITRTFHFAALWIETAALAEQGMVAFACTSAKPMVAPAGGTKPFFGTNPISFAWPRRDKPPVVFDQASAVMARGEIMVAAREGHTVPEGAGVDKDGNVTTDPNAILEGAQLAFGGYKGASIALMVELLAGPLLGEVFSVEAAEQDNGDGGPVIGGELIFAFDPEKFGSTQNVLDHGERLFSALLEQPGTRLPGDRRYRNRGTSNDAGIEIPQALYDRIMTDGGL